MRGGNPERRLIQAPAGGGDPYRQASPRGGGALLPGGSPSAPPPPSSGSRHLPSSAFGRGSSGGPQGMAEGWAPTSGASQWGAPLGESVGYGRAGAGAPSFGAVHAGIGRDGCYYTEAANHMIDECTDAAGELSSPHNLGAAGAPSEQGPHTVRRGAQGERGLLLVRGSQANGKKGETLPYVAGRSCARLCGETRTKASAAAAGAAQLTDPDDRRFFAQQQQQQQGGGDRWRVSFVRLGSGCSSDITGDSMEGPPAFGNGSGAPHEGGRMCPSDEGGGPPSPPPRGSSSAASVAAYSHRPSRYISTAGAALLSQGGGAGAGAGNGGPSPEEDTESWVLGERGPFGQRARLRRHVLIRIHRGVHQILELQVAEVLRLIQAECTDSTHSRSGVLTYRDCRDTIYLLVTEDLRADELIFQLCKLSRYYALQQQQAAVAAATAAAAAHAADAAADAAHAAHAAGAAIKKDLDKSQQQQQQQQQQQPQQPQQPQPQQHKPLSQRAFDWQEQQPQQHLLQEVQQHGVPWGDGGAKESVSAAASDLEAAAAAIPEDDSACSLKRSGVCQRLKDEKAPPPHPPDESPEPHDETGAPGDDVPLKATDPLPLTDEAQQQQQTQQLPASQSCGSVSSNNSHKLPFEFAALECIFFAAFQQLNADILYLEGKYSEAQQRTRTKGELLSLLMEDLHALKEPISLYKDRVDAFDKAFDELISNNTYLQRMELSKFAKHPNLYEEPPDKEGVNADLEILLEYFDQEIDQFKIRVRHLKGSIEDSERLLTLRLAVMRNSLIKSELAATLLAAGLAVGTSISGIFGMNLENGSEEGAPQSHQVFVAVSSVIAFTAALSFLAVLYLVKTIRL